MKIKELKEKLKNFDDEAKIIVCYSHNNKSYYNDIEELEENQILKDNKIISNKKLILMWLKK